MPCPHNEITIVQRSQQQSAVAAAAYQSGEKLFCEYDQEVINSRNAVVRGYAERNAINAPIQGSAADIIKVAMVKIFQRFQSESIRSKMILQVHDELNFSVVPEEKEKVQQIVMEEMEKAYLMQVPLKADCGWGNNWLEAH